MSRSDLAAIDRRDFLKRSLGAALLGSGFVLVSCSSDGGSDPNGGGACTNAVAGDVDASPGHGHSMDDVCQEDAGGSLNLTLTGNGHTHSISLSATQVDNILAGLPVTVTSTNNSAHTHDVSFN
jgi:hypothetical protein